MAYYHSKYGSRRKKKRPAWVNFLFWFLILDDYCFTNIGIFTYTG